MAKFLSNINLETANDIQFKTTAGANAGKISQTGDDLVISNAVGDILLGNGSDDVYIGDGTNAVDIRFEQNMAIFADSSSTRTLTLGGSNTNLVLETPTINGSVTLPATTINSKMTFGTNAGYILFDYEPTTASGEYSSEVPLLRVDRSGTELTILSRVSNNGGVILGNDDGVAILAGDVKSTIYNNLNLSAEEVVFAAEGGWRSYSFPSNTTDWSNRNEFRFYGADSTAANNGLYIGDGGSTQFIDLSRNLTVNNITAAGNINNINEKVGTNVYLRNYELSTGAGGGSFLIGKIEHGSSTDGAISATVHFAYDYGTTTNNCTLHFNFAQRSGTARGTWWYEADDQDVANDRVHARLIDDGSGNMYVWVTCADYSVAYVEARHRFSSNYPASGTLTAASITSGTTLFDTANDPTAEIHVGNVYAHGSIIKNGGSSSDFLKADGSTDSNTYSTATGVENNADVTDATNVAAAGAIMDGDFTSQGFMKRGSSAGSYSIDTNTYSTATGVENNADVTDATNVAAAGAIMDGDFSGSSGFMKTDGSGSYSIDTSAYITSQRAISSTPTDGATTTAISSDWAFDNVKTAVPSSAVFTDTVPTDFVSAANGGTFTGDVVINKGSTAVATKTFRRDATGDGVIIGDINFSTSAAEGTDDRIGLIRTTTQGGGTTTRGGIMNLYTRAANSSSFNTTSYNHAGDWSFPGAVTIAGNLNVNGTTTTIDTTNLNVEDNNITLNYSSGDSSASADNAGITIQDAVDASNNATMLWDASNDRFVFSHSVVAGSTVLTGDQDISGIATNATAISNNATAISNNATAITAAGTYTQHEDITAASSNLDNSGRTYIQDITLDDNGHVTGIGVATETVTNTDTNKFLSSITKPANSNALQFGVTNGSTVSFTFGSNAYNSTTIPTGNAAIDWSVSGEEAVIHSSYYTDTVYTHPTYSTTNINTSGSTIVDSITTNSTGHITAMGTRTLSLSDLGFSGNSAANCVLNASQTLTNKTIDADNNTISDLVVSNFKASAVVIESEGIGSNDNDTTIPTSAAVKDYVDNAVIADTDTQDLSISGNTISLDRGGSVDISNATAVAANTAKTSFPGFGTSNSTALRGDTTIPSISGLATETYVDTAEADAISAAATSAASLYVPNTGTTTIGGTKTITGSLILNDGVGSSPTMRFINGRETNGSSTPDEVSIFCNPTGKMKFQQKIFGGSNVVQATLDSSGLHVDNGLKVGTGATITTILDEDAMGSNSATALATQQSIKAYVDAEVSSAGGGTMSSWNLDSDGNSAGTITHGTTVSIDGGTGITTSRSGPTITITNSAPAGSNHLNSNTTKSDVGLGSVENKSSATIRGEITSSNVTTALGFTPTANTGTTTASNTQTFTNKSIDANGTGNSITNIDIGNMTADVIVTESEGIGNNDNDTTIPTSAAVVDYVDNNASSGQTYSVSVPTNTTKLRLSASGGTTDDIEFTGGTDISVTRTNGSALSIAYTGSGGYTLPAASSGALGGIKTGFSTNGSQRNYAVTLSNQKAYVNVPWTDNNTWIANSSSSVGYVASGNGQSNKVWKTDGSGNPAWRTDSNTNTQRAAGNGMALDGNEMDLDINSQTELIVAGNTTTEKFSFRDTAFIVDDPNETANNPIKKVFLYDLMLAMTTNSSGSYSGGLLISGGTSLANPTSKVTIGLNPNNTNLTSIYNTGLKVGNATDGLYQDWSSADDAGEIRWWKGVSGNPDVELMELGYEGSLEVLQDVTADSQILTSDRKLKKNIETLNYGLDEVLKLKPVRYEWKESYKKGKGSMIGFVSQDVQEIVPEVINESKIIGTEDTKLGIDYAKMVVVLTNAIQEQQKQIDELKKLVNGNTN